MSRLTDDLSALVIDLGSACAEETSTDELDLALGTLGWDLRVTDVYRLGGVGGVVVAVGVVLVVHVLTGPHFVHGAILAGAVSGVGVACAIRRFPIVFAALYRTRAVGAAASLVGLAILRIRLHPTVESAARFTAEAGDGPLAESLRDHVDRSTGTPQTGVATFAAEWSTWFPALERAVSLLDASVDAPPEERSQTLERARTTVLDESRDRMAAFATTIRGPATGLYAFGVLLPLALVGILPTASVAGMGVGLPTFVLLYDFLLPLGLCWAGVRLLLRRPVAFPPPTVERSHPDVPDGYSHGLVAGVAGTVGGGILGSLVVTGSTAVTATQQTPLAGWSTVVGAVGVGLGAGLFVHFRPVKEVRDRVRAVESGLDDALSLIGLDVADGQAVETAVARASTSISGATGDILTAAVGRSRRLDVGVRKAFLGDHGALSTVPSPRARQAAALLSLAAREGRPAGTAVVAMGEQLAELSRIEREGRRELAQVTGTLTNTAAFFAPLVGGATVAMAARMAAVDATADAPTGVALPPDALGIAVGGYVFALAVILTALSIGLSDGLDRSLVGYRVGLALLCATPTYLASTAAATLLL
ncbi:MAG: type II secretion system protein [Halobacteriota archaeon]